MGGFIKRRNAGLHWQLSINPITNFWKKTKELTKNYGKRKGHPFKQFSTACYGIGWKKLGSSFMLRNPWGRRQALLARASANLFWSRRMWKESDLSKTFNIILILCRIEFKAELFRLSFEFRAFIKFRTFDTSYWLYILIWLTQSSELPKMRFRWIS